MMFVYFVWEATADPRLMQQSPDGRLDHVAGGPAVCGFSHFSHQLAPSVDANLMVGRVFDDSETIHTSTCEHPSRLPWR